MVKTGDDKNLSPKVAEKQKLKGTYDSPCHSVCNYEGLFKECGTCHMRKSEKNLWKTGDPLMKQTILNAIKKRLT